MKFRDPDASVDKNMIKLSDGQSVIGVLAGEPSEKKLHWINRKPHLCSEDNDCGHCLSGDKAKFRFSMNMIMKDGKTLTVKVLDQGWQLYAQLATLSKGGWKLDRQLVKVSRVGSGPQDTEYFVIPVPSGEINEPTWQRDYQPLLTPGKATAIIDPLPEDAPF